MLTTRTARERPSDLRLAIAPPGITYLGTANPSTLLALMMYPRNETSLVGMAYGRVLSAEPKFQPDRPRFGAKALRSNPLRAAEIGKCRRPTRTEHSDLADLQLVVTGNCRAPESRQPALPRGNVATKRIS